jgi:dTMP kinase
MSIIAIEGIDACGKQTQVALLKEYLGRNAKVQDFSFPNYSTATGKKISELLKAEERDPLVLQALMTVNRYECQDEIMDALREGFAILDRYWFSGYVYGKTDKLNPQWLFNIHTRLIQPDRWIILDIPPEESFRRRPVREDQYETEFWRVKQARDMYLELARTELPLSRRVSVIDATQDEEIVLDNILRECGI